MLELLAGRAALRLGDRRRAAQALRTANEWLKRHDPPYVAAVASQLRAELSLVEGRLDEAVEALRAALGRFESYPVPHDRAMALLDASRLAIQVRVDRRAPVADWLRHSVTLFDRLGNPRRRAQAIEIECDWLRVQVEHGLVEAERGLIEKVGQLLHSLADHQELTQRAMEIVVEQFDAERGVLLARDEATGAMEPIAQCGAEDATSAEEALRFSRGLVQRVVDAGRSIYVHDAPRDPQAATQSVDDLRLRALLCVPMFQEGRVVGAVYLDSRRPGVFGEAERKLLEGFAQMMAVALERSRATERLASENLKLRREMTVRVRAGLLGSSRALQKVVPLIERAAQSKATVLLTGETGTGKGLVAEVIHQSGPRARGPFVAVNCPAVEKTLWASELFGVRGGAATGVTYAEGCFRAAEGGTLFLDEITEIPLDQQGALLKAVEEGKVAPVGMSAESVPVNVRIIAATNRDLRSLIEQGRFREDLFQRLNVFPIEMPPLRDRKGDIAELAVHFATQVALRDNRPVPELAPDFLAHVMQEDWKQGNVRELSNHVERAVVLSQGDVLHGPLSAKRPPRLSTSSARNLKDEQEAHERARFEQALRRFNGNQSKAADSLGLRESTFRARMAKHGMQGRRKLRPE
jgi:Nif-specific regulatory protein